MILSAKYIFRLDDATPFSDKNKWSQIEDIFNEFDIKPIVAVTPDNKDTKLMYSKKDINFWEKVVSWERKGWDIAMHGYQHLYHKVDKKKLLIPYYNRSEFAGLTMQEQVDKIKNSLFIFRENGIDPKVWVAPSHSFDDSTLIAIKNETNINIVSDGIAIHPFFDKGFNFIPQQLWSIKRKFFGVWTICLHPDTMQDEEIKKLREDLASTEIYKNTICIKDIKFGKSNKSYIDSIYVIYYWTRYRILNVLRPIKNSILHKR